MENPYQTVSERSTAEFNIKGSRFIARLANCPDESSISSILDQLRIEFPSATHYCYATIFNGSDRSERFSDNGEPSGTAGRPILNVLRGTDLSDVILVVIRYFGGTLLGTGGLVQAYSETAKAVTVDAKIVEMVPCIRSKIVLDYQDYGKYEKRWSPHLLNQSVDFAERVSITASVPKDIYDEFLASITDLTKGTGHVTQLNRCYTMKKAQ